jgi:alkylhydroperoxidase family enzyme
VALGAGLTRDEVTALRGERPIESTFETPLDFALVDLADAIADGGSPVAQGVLTRLTTFFSEGDVVELTMTACTTLLLNRYATALDLPVADSHLKMLAEFGW